jgi:hypothetical protein
LDIARWKARRGAEYGYVRFFPPSYPAALTDWEAFDIDGVRAV